MQLQMKKFHNKSPVQRVSDLAFEVNLAVLVKSTYEVFNILSIYLQINPGQMLQSPCDKDARKLTILYKPAAKLKTTQEYKKKLSTVKPVSVAI